MLQETLNLQYSGMPFGPSVAVLSAGLQGSNANLWGGDVEPSSGRSATLDVAVGLLPRRAVPVRVYLRGTLAEGSPQFVTIGGRERLAFGANVNLEPGGWMPGLRLDFDEEHFSGLNPSAPLGDERRMGRLGLSRSFGAHRVALSLRFEQEHRALISDWHALTLTSSWLSPLHETSASASILDRQLTQALPGLPNAVEERQVRVDHVQRLTMSLSADAHGRLEDARFSTGQGSLGQLSLGGRWRPFTAHELAVSANADLGFTDTSGAGHSNSSGGSGRLSYARPVGPIQLGGFAGGGSQWCACAGLAHGFLSSLDAGATLSTIGLAHLEARADYRFSLVDAPLGRGGKHREHHVAAFARSRFTTWGQVTLNAGYDDGFRDYIDVNATLTSLHEQALSVGGAVTIMLGRGSGTLEVRHVRGSAVLPPGGLVSGPPVTARAISSGSITGLVPIVNGLDASVSGRAAWTTLDSAAPLFTAGATAGVSVRLGRIIANLQYEFGSSNTQGLQSFQHFVRLSLLRPFEIF
jgi:hypothetical protein